MENTCYNCSSGNYSFSAYKIIAYLSEVNVAVKSTNELSELAVSFNESESIPIYVNFDILLERNDDIVGWIYSEDTPINYPIVQSDDNNYYLRRLTDGTYNRAGTLFMDCKNASDFSDYNTIIYGHNMKTDIMFGTLPNYSKQSYYNNHPVMWLLTPTTNFKIEVFAGFVTYSTSYVYDSFDSFPDFENHISNLVSDSDFEADADLSNCNKIITLSTCSYENSSSRYVIIGKMVEVAE